MKKRLSLHEKAFRALKEAVKEVVVQHKKTGLPLAIHRNGKNILIYPRKKNRISLKLK